MKRFIEQGMEKSQEQAGASVPMKLGCATLLACICVHQPGSSLNSVLKDFYSVFIMWA